MSRWRHLFWDFDGTLYDSYPQVARAMRLTLAEHGVDADEKELLPPLKVTVFHTACLYAERAGLDAQALMRTFQRYHQAEGAFPPYEGLGDCLRRLKRAGCSHYLYTHRDRRAVEQLRADGLWELFTDAVTREDGYPDKPAPDALLAMARAHGLRPEECAMIGDRDIDVLSGVNAGMGAVLFDPDGYYSALRVDMRARSMEELAARLLNERA